MFINCYNSFLQVLKGFLINPLMMQGSSKDLGDETLLFFYMAKEGRVEGSMYPEYGANGDLIAVRGSTTDLGNYAIRYYNFLFL